MNENFPNGSPTEIYRQRLFEVSHNIDEKDLVEYFDLINSKVSEWKKEYGENVAKYELYHVLIGSTPLPGQKFVAFDLPHGEVAAFIEELENKYGKR